MRDVINYIYENYNSMSDTLFTVGNLAIKFYVKFNYNVPNKGKRSYYSECTYMDKNGDIGMSIQRRIFPHLSIENRMLFEGMTNKEYIIINIGDMFYVNSRLSAMAQILLDPNTFKYNSNNRLELVKAHEEIGIQLYGKRLEMIPIVINRENGQVQGVRVTLQEANNYTDITIDEFMGIYQIFKTIDVYGYAASMLAFMGRPEFGTNNYNMISNSYNNNNNSPFK